MLRTAMGHAIEAWLEDPAIVEIMLSPDGRLWIDRLAGGLSDTGKRLSAEDGERILRVVAHQVGGEVRSGSPQHLPVRAASCRSSVRGGVALEFEFARLTRRQRLVRLLSPKANTSAQAELLRCNRGRFIPRSRQQTRPSTPTQIVIAEWKRADALAGDFENRLGNGGCHLRNDFLADSRNPLVVGLQELNVDVGRIVRHPGNLEFIEIAFDHAPILDGNFLPHCVAQAQAIWPSICLRTESGLTSEKPSSNTTSTRSSRSCPRRLIDTVTTSAHNVVAVLVCSARRRSSAAMPRAQPSGRGVPQPDILATVSNALSQSSRSRNF